MFSPSKAFNFADLALTLPIEALESALKKDQDLVNIRGYGGQTALHKAILVGNHSVALILLRYGANPNVATDTGDTSLHIACSRGALKLLLALLNFGGDLNILNRNGHLPLHCASQSGSIIIISFLCEVYGCSLEVPDASGATVLHSACLGGHLELVKFLLEVKNVFCLGADANGNTILHSGAMGGVSGICWSIIAHGGESLLASKNRNGQTPFQLAQNSLNVSIDCKNWLEKWTKEYEKRKKVSSPTSDWIILLLTPFFLFHAVIVLSRLSFPDKQWTVAVPGFMLLSCIVRRQQHRISHPARLANPIYAAAYITVVSSSFISYLCCFIQNPSIPRPLFAATFSMFLAHIYLLFYLLIKDPGRILPNENTKDALMRLAEDRLEGRFCPVCSLSAPPASHHCRLCDKCFLLLDHHCLFLNTCIAVNNHWQFVVFILVGLAGSLLFTTTCFFYAPVQWTSVSDWLTPAVIYWIWNDVWTGFLIVCHILVLCWASSLLRYQFHVIGSQQTTYFRLKAGTSKARYSTMQKLSNFLKFLYYKRISMRNSSHYIEA